MRCPNCGSEIEAASVSQKFCSNCGAMLQSSADVPPSNGKNVPSALRTDHMIIIKPEIVDKITLKATIGKFCVEKPSDKPFRFDLPYGQYDILLESEGFTPCLKTVWLNDDVKLVACTSGVRSRLLAMKRRLELVEVDFDDIPDADPLSEIKINISNFDKRVPEKIVITLYGQTRFCHPGESVSFKVPLGMHKITVDFGSKYVPLTKDIQVAGDAMYIAGVTGIHEIGRAHV